MAAASEERRECPRWVREALSDRDWYVQTWRKLVGFIGHRIRGYQRGLSRGTDPQVAAHSSEDIVQSAIVKVLTGERQVPDKVTDRDQLRRWLYDVVASVLSNEGKSAEVKLIIDPLAGEEGDEELSLEDLAGDAAWKDDDSLRDWWLTVSDRLADEPELLETARAAVDGCLRPQDYAAYLGVTVEESVNRLRRLRRRFRDLME
ncbi:MAG: hypothetical protein LDL56_04030 [Armatimonadetes bacterium]|jgi:DNA-directed RNA polymerase specialized sigma24 family protein|nr:hypothetical protein [Armatimonadota bacterium]MCA1996381.1 hypothetical protein [Armatimonadota bacterium]